MSKWVSAAATRMYLGSWAEAERSLRKASKAARRLGIHHVDAAAKHNLGLALAVQATRPTPAGGRAPADLLREGRALEEESVAAFASQGDRRLECGARIYLARILMIQGDLVAAVREARAAVGLAGDLAPLRCTAFGVTAQALLAQGRGAEALHDASQAMRLIDPEVGLEEGDALVRPAHAEALAAVGQAAEARAALASAAQRLAARARAITSPAARRSFLEDVPENARTSTLAQSWLGDDALASMREASR